MCMMDEFFTVRNKKSDYIRRSCDINVVCDRYEDDQSIGDKEVKFTYTRYKRRDI